MRNRWMQIIPSQSSSSRTEFQQIRWIPDQWQDRTSHNYSEKISNCQNCLKISHRRTFSFCMTKQCEFMVTIVSSKDPWKDQNYELRQNFITDEMQLHTSTRSELNLIKSVIYIIFTFYLYFIFYILKNKQHQLR